MTLREVFQRSAEFGCSDWLYLAGERQSWSLDSQAYVFSDLDADPERGDSIVPADLEERGLAETIDLETVRHCITLADKLSRRPDDAVRLESFLYYVRFDAFLPRIGAPEPASGAEITTRLDLEFYDRLGAEDTSRSCRKENCGRGAIQHSVFCRPHHFEMIKRKKCPFGH